MLGSLLRGRYIRRGLLAWVGDLACFLAAAALAWLVLSPPFPLREYAMVALGGAALATLALVYCEAYRPGVLGSTGGTLRAVTMSMGLAFAAALLIYFLVPIPVGFMRAAAHTAVFFFPLVLLERTAFRKVSARLADRVIVVGVSDLGAGVARVLHERPNMGMELLGFVTDDEALQGQAIEGEPVLGRISEIEKLLDELRIDRVLVASRDRNEYFPAEQLLAAKLRGCRIESALAFLEHTTGRIHPRDLRPSYLIFSDGFQPRVLGDALKRGFDLIVASGLLVLAAPVLGLAALAIRLESPGPVFYRQERVGKRGRVFQVLKLRSMLEGAEEATGAIFASSGDPRVTRVGRILRMTRLDEVPQFWNVLLGEMSLVGPRPERPEFVEALGERYPLFHLRSSVRPGVTGWAQVRFGYVSDFEAFEQKLSLDLFYLKYRSLALDLLILWATLKTVLLFRGL
jgi:exopolysaccharide biosynthesis polyprenyl glycosylphosphotransferase